MKYSYSLSREDYLNYLYYSTSTSKRVRKRRAINKLLLMIMYVITGLFLYNRSGPFASALFFLLCLPLYFFYNAFEKKQYKKHFTRFIDTHFKDRIGQTNYLEFDDNSLHITDDEENHLLFSDIESIAETGNLIMIQAKNGNAFIIPKSAFEPTDAFFVKLDQITTGNNIPYQKDLNWKWK